MLFMKNKHQNHSKYKSKMRALYDNRPCPLFDGKSIEPGLCIDIMSFLIDYPHEEPYEDYVIDNIIKDNNSDIYLIKKLCCTHALFKKYINQHLYNVANEKLVDKDEA